jgi:hypothetical protein
MLYIHVNSRWWTEERSETCSVVPQNKFVKLVRIVIKKFVTTHGHVNVKKLPKSNFYTFTTQICVITTTTNTSFSEKNFKLPWLCNWGRLSSGILCGVGWRLVAEVSGKRVGPNLKNQVVWIYNLYQNFGNTPLTNTVKYHSSNSRLVLCSSVWNEEVYWEGYSTTTLRSSRLKYYTKDKIIREQLNRILKIVPIHEIFDTENTYDD